MIIPDYKIEELAKNETSLITPFESKNLRRGSYDLTIGNEYYIGDERESSSWQTKELKRDQSFTIPAHAVCFILTEEDINLPLDVTAKLSLRMTHIYKGIVLTSQPPFDPGYSGKVIVMLYNLSSDSIHLKRGDRIATVEFSRLESQSRALNAHRSVDNLIGQLKSPLVSSLSEIAGVSRSAKKRVSWLEKQVIVFLALIVSVLAVPGFYTYSAISERVNDQQKEIGLLREEVKRLKGVHDN
ncbi:MAG: hypothetical protein LRY66_10925 [Saccharospirillaceae bacterium]|nr:hypothetical protein [Saccharospirillaceae bacterium]MCD8531844.1 hypothetical protein [Saccharospirillaceae bacterium]